MSARCSSGHVRAGRWRPCSDTPGLAPAHSPLALCPPKDLTMATHARSAEFSVCVRTLAESSRHDLAMMRPQLLLLRDLGLIASAAPTRRRQHVH